jgi:hypothetical protein
LAWDSLSSAVACVRLNDALDDVLGTSEATPADDGAFDHSFTVPEDAPQGSVLCTRIRLAGDPVGAATEAVWVSKTHCFEVDHDVDEVPPPDDSSSSTPPVQPANSTPPGPAPETPVAAPATGSGSPDSGAPGIFSPEGGGSGPGTPFDTAEATSSGPGAPAPGGPTSPSLLPLLPATGFASTMLLRRGEACLFIGLALVALFGLPRRRRSTV